jgi:hypothetical protein
MAMPPRLRPLLDEFDWAARRLTERLTGPTVDSGDGTPVEVPPMTDGEYRWEPVPDCWNVRRRAEGPGPGATVLTGTGEWGRDGGRPRPWPPPFTTIAWRMSHLSEMLTMRADHTIGTRSITQAGYRVSGTAQDAITALTAGVTAWREAVAGADDAALDMIGRSTYPDGGDAGEPFLDIVWWVNQEVLHHGAEIALLRDLHRAQHSG